MAKSRSTKFDTHGDVVLGTATWDENGKPVGIEIATNTPMIRVRLVVLDDQLHVETYDGQKVTAPVRDDVVNAWAATDHTGKVVFIAPLGQGGFLRKGDEFTLTPSNYRPPARPKADVLNPLSLEGWRKY